MIASEGLNLGTALAHLQNLSREFETLEAASIKARAELDRLTELLANATEMNDTDQSSVAETWEAEEASREPANIDEATADKTLELIGVAPAAAAVSVISEQAPAEQSAPGDDLETAFYRSVADLFAKTQTDQPIEPMTAIDDETDISELHAPSPVDDLLNETEAYATDEPVLEAREDEPLLDLFPAQDEALLENEPVNHADLEAIETAVLEEADASVEDVADTVSAEREHAYMVERDHDPELFGFQGVCLTSEISDTNDVASSQALADLSGVEASSIDSCQSEASVDLDAGDRVAALLETLTGAPDNAIETAEVTSEAAPEDMHLEVWEPVVADLHAFANEPEELSLDEADAEDNGHAELAEVSGASCDDALDTPELDEPELSAPLPVSTADLDVDDAGPTALISEKETTADPEPVEYFSAMHQPISFEEPTIEALMGSTGQPADVDTEQDQVETEAASDGENTIEVATVEPIAVSSEEQPEIAAPSHDFNRTDDQVVSQDDADPAVDKQPVEPGNTEEAPIAAESNVETSEPNQIVPMPIAEDVPKQPARSRGRAATVAGLGAIAAALAIALHPPIADELLGLPWQDMLHMNEILDKLSELKRFFAFA